ncbi:MAG: hypothetical protein Q8R37_00685 [Nanoarchaeota archaeon]|nr:hypothetical protein [Nanoarchaeota archaeon]
MSTRQVFGGLPLQEEFPSTSRDIRAYRIRRDQIDADDDTTALKEARRIKHNSIDDCYTQSRIVSISTMKGLTLNINKLVEEFDRF